MTSDKIRPHHLARKAVLYVRQSSAHQVLHNRESSALQYTMRDRLTALDWSEIEVIDDDLGRSAAGNAQRAATPVRRRCPDLLPAASVRAMRKAIARACANRSNRPAPGGCLLAEKAGDQKQAQIRIRPAATGSDDPLAVTRGDEASRGMNRDAGVTAPQVVAISPMSRRLAIVEGLRRVATFPNRLKPG
jgi:hypothetical protein